MLLFCFWKLLGRPSITYLPADPCQPTPCGPNSQCRVAGETAVCSCLVNYIGRAPNCRPECTTNSECPRNLACINEKCRDPCPGTCGSYATCTVSNHQPICRCLEQFTGDPFSTCSPIQSKKCLKSSLISKSISFNRSHRSCSWIRSGSTQSMLPVTLWCQCCVQRTKQCRILHMFARILRRPIFRMSSRMRHEQWLLEIEGMRQ